METSSSEASAAMATSTSEGTSVVSLRGLPQPTTDVDSGPPAGTGAGAKRTRMTCPRSTATDG